MSMRNITSLGQARDYGDRLSKLLKKYRELANFRLTQGDLATRIGVSARSIRDWETGINLPTARNLRKIIEVYQNLGLFTPGKEREEAEELWILRQGKDLSNTFPLFDVAWLDSITSNKTDVTKPDVTLDQPPPEQLAATSSQKNKPPIPTNLTAGNLSQQLTSFIGREKELAEISRLLSNTRLLTITGTGGAGKTRLAQEVAHGLRETAHSSYPDGIWWIELTPLTDPQQIVQAVVSALLLERQQEGELYELLRNYLNPKKLLMVLDNCEHLVEAVANFVGKLLRDCPSLQILATSRETLNVAGEQAWPLEGLSVPNQKKDQRQPEGGDIENWAAVRLFTERARAAQPSFELTSENTEVVVEICRQLDGLPLAIELAAARVKGLGVEQISRRLQQNFKLLSGGSLASTHHHQTVQAMIDWSYNLLSPEEQLLLRRMAVFRGDFSLEAAEGVLGGDAGSGSEKVDPDDVLILLLQLVNKSLVVVVSGDTHAETRYRLLEMMRQYGQQKLEESLETAFLSYKHLAYYTDFVEKDYPNNYFYQSTKWVAQLDQENPNLRAALSWGLAFSQSSTALTPTHFLVLPGELALRLSVGLGRFWHLKNYLIEGERWLKTSLTLAGLDQREDLKTVRAHAFYWLGQLPGSQSFQYNQNIQYLTISLGLFEELGDKFFMVIALGDMGTVHFMIGNYVEARTFFLRSLDLVQEIENKYFLGYILLNLGKVAIVQGDFDEALAFLQESEAIHRLHNDYFALAITLSNLAVISRIKQDFPQALSKARESLPLSQKIDNKEVTAFTLNELSVIQRKLQNYREARRLAEESKAICDEEGNLNFQSDTYTNLAIINIKEGKIAEGRQFAGQSLEINLKRSYKPGVLENLHTFALLAAAQDRWEDYVRLYEAADILRQQLSISRDYLSEQDELNRLNEQAGHHLDQATIERLRNKGQTDSLDDIVKRVLAT